MNKGSISAMLMNQAKDSLYLANEFRQSKQLSKEIQHSINTDLLLGIVLEGVVNYIGEHLVDSWTWSEMEKTTTPLKWRMVSSLKKGFDPSKEPLQTITRLQKIRNKIAHPKSEDFGDEVIIISKLGVVTRQVKNEDILPQGDFSVYVGYGKLIEIFNARNSLLNMKKVLKAIDEISVLFELNEMGWSQAILDEVKSIEIGKNEFDNKNQF